MTKLIKLSEIINTYPLSESTIFRQISAGTFPPAINLGCRSTAYLSSEIEVVMAARIAGKSENELQKLVNDLVSKRPNLLEEI